MPLSPHKLRHVLLFLVLSYSGWAGALTNQLKDHPSPYLALHGEDPVAWQDWTSDAVALSRQQQKLIYISIGYFSCHWCHVMQRESYQNDAIAKLLNDNFIPVKVDRELEQALDARMIEFARATQGRAGWPLNVFLTPQGHPLYAVLYLPTQDFGQVLTRLNELWRTDRENLVNLAAREAAAAEGPGAPLLDPVKTQMLGETLVTQALGMADTREGGFGASNKFPMAPQLEFLFERYRQDGSEPLKQFLILTLDRMAENGMYDHVGDGFFRYATDPQWNTPHFEKMLYDNAQLAVLYLHAADLFDAPRFADVARRTLDFMLRDMTGEDGAMVASFSAVDDHDVEGGYYLWQKIELAKFLSREERDVVERAWAMDGPLVFEAGYLPKKGTAPAQIGAELKYTETEVADHIESARAKLFIARTGRVLPTDTKLLAGWNGLALAGLAEAARITGNEAYEQGARRIRDYIMEVLWDGQALRRAVDGSRELGKASLEDYAYVSKGLWVWAELTQKQEDFAAASNMVGQAWSRFYDQGWRLSESSLIATEPLRDLITDGPMPSPAAVVAEISLNLANRFDDAELRKQALSALNSGEQHLQQNGFWYASHVQAMLLAVEN